jgi:hypothetical protein
MLHWHNKYENDMTRPRSQGVARELPYDGSGRAREGGSEKLPLDKKY